MVKPDTQEWETKRRDQRIKRQIHIQTLFACVKLLPPVGPKLKRKRKNAPEKDAMKERGTR